MRISRILTLALTLLCSPAFAIIDMKAGNFADTALDLLANGTGYDLRVQRTYNSRVIYNGIFGFGWCSDFETRLEVTPEGNLKVVECGAGAEVLYTPRGFDAKSVDKTINSIVAEIKRRNPSLTEKALNELIAGIRSDDFIREEFARRFNIKGSPAGKDTTYYANGRGAETVVRTNDGYRRNMRDGTFQLFDQVGRVTNLYDKAGNSLKLSYDKGLMTLVVDNNGRRLTLSYDTNSKKVRRVTGPNGAKAEYTYRGDNLVQVKTAFNTTFKYDYDDVHNLTKVTYPNGSSRELSYNKDKDWVTSFKDERGCVESYDYKIDSKDSQGHFTSSVTKKCGDKVTNRSTYDFYHKPRLDGTGLYLHQVVADINGDRSEVIYHEIFGKPLLVLKGGQRTEYAYHDNGLVKSKFEGNRRLSFDYNKECNKASRIETEYLDLQPGRNAASTNAKVLRKVTTSFRYDSKKCLLSFAENSDGQKIRIEYDVRGRVAAFEDQSKKVLKIKYEERTGKPEVLTRPGLGTVKLVYRSDGEVERAESSDGDPRVAVQVLSIFGNLLEIISPAGTEANI